MFPLEIGYHDETPAEISGNNSNAYYDSHVSFVPFLDFWAPTHFLVLISCIVPNIAALNLIEIKFVLN